MISKSIVSTKLIIPPVRSRYVSRKRLTDSLNAGVGYKLTLVTAPAGYGKTTMLSIWAAQSSIPVTWLSLDEKDNDEDRFITHLVASLQFLEKGQDVGKSALALRQSAQPSPPQAILTLLINALVSYGKDFALIFDDFHVITNPELHEFVASFIGYLPPNIRFIIASRAIPPLPLATLRVHNDLLEITTDDLKFTEDETRVFLQEVMELGLPEANLKAIAAYSEGWAASLLLAALSLKERKDARKMSAQLRGSQRLIFDYLVEEVLEDLPQEIQDFLHKTCVLESLTAPLCDAIPGITDSRALLEYLEREKIFTTVIDPEHQWFRYHKLFADVLLEQMRRSDIDQTSIHAAAARWYQVQGYHAEAINHYIAGSMYKSAADVIEDVALEFMGKGEFSSIARWIQALPYEIVMNRPRLVLSSEWANLIRYPVLFWSATDSSVERMAGSLGVQPESLVSILANEDLAASGRNLLSEYAILLAFVARQRGDLDQAITWFGLADRQLTSNMHFMRAIDRAGMGSVLLRKREFAAAERAFCDAVKASRAAGSFLAQVVSLGFQAWMQVFLGQLEKAKNTYKRGIELLVENLGQHAPLTGQVWVGLADIYRERNDLETALKLVLEGIRRGEAVRDVDALSDGYITLARVKLVMGDSVGAVSAIESALQVAEQVQDAELNSRIASWKARLSLMRGDRNTVLSWLQDKRDTGFVLGPPDWGFDVSVENTTYARILIADHQADRAIKWLDKARQELERNDRKHELLEILVLSAMACQSLGQRQIALRTLAQALLLAEPNGYVRVFLDEGAPMAALLRSAGADGHSPHYVRTLLTSFGNGYSVGGVSEPLSERELQVLTLIGQGYTNREIAEELVISQSTVKTHINRIYSKVGVDNRTQAAIHARRLGLV